jgi:hypothetical protein
MNHDFWKDLSSKVFTDISRQVLSDITVRMKQKQNEGLRIDDIEMMEIINSLHDEYGRNNQQETGEDI